jgi:hypothetical protein
VRYDDPILETIARSIHLFFPRCVRCGEPIESFDDADIRILSNRVVHRAQCGVRDAGRGMGDAPRVAGEAGGGMRE